MSGNIWSCFLCQKPSATESGCWRGRSQLKGNPAFSIFPSGFIDGVPRAVIGGHCTCLWIFPSKEENFCRLEWCRSTAAVCWTDGLEQTCQNLCSAAVPSGPWLAGLYSCHSSGILVLSHSQIYSCLLVQPGTCLPSPLNPVGFIHSIKTTCLFVPVSQEEWRCQNIKERRYRLFFL